MEGPALVTRTRRSVWVWMLSLAVDSVCLYVDIARNWSIQDLSSNSSGAHKRLAPLKTIFIDSIKSRAITSIDILNACAREMRQTSGAEDFLQRNVKFVTLILVSNLFVWVLLTVSCIGLKPRASLAHSFVNDTFIASVNRRLNLLERLNLNRYCTTSLQWWTFAVQHMTYTDHA